MEITTKGMTATKIRLINLMTAIYLTNHQKRQLVDFLRQCPGCISALTLKFNK